MSVLLKTTVGEIAASKPHAANLFDVLGIDYVCHGNLCLHDACAEAGLDSVQIRKSLDQLTHDATWVNWLEQPLRDLLEYLRGKRHPALSAALARAAETLYASCPGCDRHPEEMAALRRTFGGLADAMRPHLSREERVLFPIIEHLDACWSRGEAPTLNLSSGLRPAVNSLMLDHSTMIATLNTIRSSTDDLMEYEDRCEDLVTALRSFDRELREHVHLENNVLYPRAVALEAIVSNDTITRSETHA
jgi:regulator of cell morphogenesis and NO signaling